MRRPFLLAFAATFAAAVALVGSPASAASATHVSVTLREMTIVLSTATVPAGEVVLDITNAGTVVHEVVFLKTDVEGGALPARATDPAKAQEVGEMAEAEDIDPGKTATLELTLTPGRYVLICNEPGHHAAGMHASFVVASTASIALKEMTVQSEETVALAGPVTFSISNHGTAVHELIVLRTDLAEGSIPARVEDPSRAQEPGAAGEAEDIDPGSTATLTLDLGPGRYVLICNEPGHYAAGMHTTFTVMPTQPRSQAAGIELALEERGIDSADQASLVNVDALLTAPGIVVTDADRAAIVLGFIPRSITTGGTFLY